jgi:UPF0271 protein
MRVDLNCDVGEGAPDDAALIAIATSVNVACGMHAGDPVTMRRTVALAAPRGVAIGAHPGYPDREGMGRRDLALPPDEAADAILYQIGALEAFVRAAGARLAHVKLHGALYNAAARQAPLADAAARAVAAASAGGGRPLLFVGLAGTEHERAAARAGLPFAAEVFADRTVGPDGQPAARRSGRVRARSRGGRAPRARHAARRPRGDHRRHVAAGARGHRLPARRQPGRGRVRARARRPPARRRRHARPARGRRVRAWARSASSSPARW